MHFLIQKAALLVFLQNIVSKIDSSKNQAPVNEFIFKIVAGLACIFTREVFIHK